MAPTNEPTAAERKLMRYKKAPDAPKRFKSAFIIFSAENHKVIKEDLAAQGRTEKTTDIAKLVSEAWRALGPEDKEVWEKKARKDKARYEVEKAMYKGPWKVPANKRTPKDPSAPKRPMSAFLAFSNKRRAALKRQTPDATNADLSKMLSVTWKEAPDDLRKKYMEEEAGLRATYKVKMGDWRKKVAEEKKEERKEREAMALQAAEARAAQITAGGGDSVAVGGPAGAQGAAGMQGGSGMFNPYMAGVQGSMGMGFQGGYPGMMGNPFAAQMMQIQQGMTASSDPQQQQLMNQLLANQQFMQRNGQFGGLYGGQTLPGGQTGSGGQGGFGDVQQAQQALMQQAQAGGQQNPGMAGFGHFQGAPAGQQGQAPQLSGEEQNGQHQLSDLQQELGGNM